MVSQNKSNFGFTLIELVIVVAIIGILTSLAYPGYVEQVRKSRRADLTSDLQECSAILERRYTVNRTYGPAANNTLCDSIQNDHYTISVIAGDISPNGNSNSFSVSAVPAAGGSMTGDSNCATFALNQFGNKNAEKSDNSDHTEFCWRN